MPGAMQQGCRYPIACEYSTTMGTHGSLLTHQASVVMWGFCGAFDGAAESWALTSSQEARLDLFVKNCLRRITGHRRGPDSISNEKLWQLTQQPPASALLREHRLRWFGHLVRMHAWVQLVLCVHNSRHGVVLRSSHVPTAAK